MKNGLEQNVLDFASMHVTMSIMTRIPKILRLIPTIHSIFLYDNLLRDSGLQSLYQILSANSQISSIDVGCNDLSDGCIICLTNLIRTTGVKKMQLGCKQVTWQANRLSREGLGQILETISQTDQMECLGISGIIGTRLKKASSRSFSTYVATLVKTCKKLSTLDISYLGFTESDQFPLYDGFAYNDTLRYLNISGNSFPTGTKLVEGICRVSSLKYLNLSNCELSTPAIMTISSKLAQGWELIYLDLSQNRIGNLGANHLFNTLKTNINLVSLNMSDNEFDHSIASNLQSMLMLNQVLEVLDLSKNLIGDKIAMVIADVIEENQILTNINLSSCRISDEGALALTYAIVNNTTLRRLHLRDNFLSEHIGFELINILKKNEQLLWLDLSSNQVDKFAIDAIIQLCKRNKIIQKENKLMPLRREIIRLSIQKAKIPHVEANKKSLDERLSILEKENDQLDLNFENFQTSSMTTLKTTNKAIKEFEKMMKEEKNAIQDMEDSLKELQDETEKQVVDVASKMAEEERLYNVLIEEAGKLEKETELITMNTENETTSLMQQIDFVEKMLEEIQTQTRKASTLKKYQIPKYPFEEVQEKLKSSRSKNGKSEESLTLPGLPNTDGKKSSRKKSARKAPLTSARRSGTKPPKNLLLQHT